MSWIIETAIDWIWTDLICATYKRYGWLAAAAVFAGPFIVIALVIGLLVMALL